MAMGPTYLRQDLRSVSKNASTSFNLRPWLLQNPKMWGPLMVTLPARPLVKALEHWPDPRNTTVLMTVGKGDRYAWRIMIRLLPLYHEKDRLGMVHSRSGAAPLTDRDTCGTRIPGREQSQAQPRSRASMALCQLHLRQNGSRAIHYDNTSSWRSRVCEKTREPPSPSINVMDASLKRTAVREFLYCNGRSEAQKDSN